VPGYVNLFDSLYHDSVIIEEVEEQTNDLLGGCLIALDPKPVQQQQKMAVTVGFLQLHLLPVWSLE